MTNIQPLAVNTLGQIGLPAPVKELAKKSWDAIIVGAGHNGLAAAAYLAREGKQVLVLENRDRVGGANTLEEVYPGVRMSPCAYVVGLLHPLLLSELKMKENGFRWIPATGGTFVPFADGTSLQMSYDDAKCEAEVKAFAPEDFEGWKAMCALKRQVRDAIRPEGKGDSWVGRSPSRAELEDRLSFSPLASKLVFEWSMVEFLDHFLTNEKFQMSYLGQGVIGTNLPPQAPGTAYVNFHHASGRMDGNPGTWGYVVGGMGMISFILCDIARNLGATIATGVPVAEIIPGEGVRLEGGEKISSPVVISNADPKATSRLLGKSADPKWNASIEKIPMQGCTLGLVHQQQTLFYKENLFSSKFAHVPDFVAIARGFGIEALNLDLADDPKAALTAAIQAKGPCLIHASIDMLQKVYPMVPPGAANKDMIGH